MESVTPQSIKLSGELLEQARRASAVHSRSVPKQIEHWSRIGRIAEENPDLPYQFIMDILVAQQEQPEPFVFGSK